MTCTDVASEPKHPEAKPATYIRIGTRLPDGLREDGIAVFDQLDTRRLTLLTFGATHEDVVPMLDAARAKSVQIKVLPLHEPHLAQLYEHRFVLVLPGKHVCWCADEMPVTCWQVIETIRGAGRSSWSK